MKIGKLEVKRYSHNSEWTTYLVEKLNQPANIRIRIKKKNGNTVTVPALRSKYYLAFNGFRFAGGVELKAFKRDFPKLSNKVIEFIQSCHKATT